MSSLESTGSYANNNSNNRASPMTNGATGARNGSTYRPIKISYVCRLRHESPVSPGEADNRKGSSAGV